MIIQTDSVICNPMCLSMNKYVLYEQLFLNLFTVHYSFYNSLRLLSSKRRFSLQIQNLTWENWRRKKFFENVNNFKFKHQNEIKRAALASVENPKMCFWFNTCWFLVQNTKQLYSFLWHKSHSKSRLVFALISREKTA